MDNKVKSLVNDIIEEAEMLKKHWFIRFFYPLMLEGILEEAYAIKYILEESKENESK